MSNERKEIAWIYNVLGHPIRRRMVEMLGEGGHVGFSDFKSALNASVGTLYYHLDMLGDLITQDEKRKYVLTEQGRLALKLLGSSEAHLLSMMAEKRKPSVGGYIRRLFLPGWLFSAVSASPLKFVPEMFIVIAFGAWISVQTNLQLIMLFYNQTATTQMTLILSFIFSWLTIFALVDIVTTFAFKRTGGDLSLLVGTALSQLPLLVFPCIVWVYRMFNWFFPVGLWAQIPLLLLQAWALGFLSTAVSLSKGLRVDKAALVSLMIMYVNIAYLVLFVLRT